MAITFSVCIAAGVRPSDIARLLRISRVAASLWINGHSQPHRFIEKRVQRMLSAVSSALSSGDLPISRDVPRGERYDATVAVITKHLNGLGLASIDE